MMICKHLAWISTYSASETWTSTNSKLISDWFCFFPLNAYWNDHTWKGDQWHVEWRFITICHLLLCLFKQINYFCKGKLYTLFYLHIVIYVLNIQSAKNKILSYVLLEKEEIIIIIIINSNSLNPNSSYVVSYMHTKAIYIYIYFLFIFI